MYAHVQCIALLETPKKMPTAADCDLALFEDPHFSAKRWVNQALAESRPDGAGATAAATAGSAAAAADSSKADLNLQLSVLLTKLQLAATDVDADVHRWCVDLNGMTPVVVRELGQAREQASAVRSELASLLEEVASLEARSEGSLGSLRDAVAIRERLTSTARTLQQAGRVASLMRTADTASARGDAAAAAAAVSQLGGAIEALGDARAAELFPDAAARLPQLRAQVLDKLKPALLRAVREHDAAAMPRLSALFAELGASAQVRETYVQCAQGPIFERWNAARREASAADAFRALWGCVEALVPAERAWVANVLHAQGGARAAARAARRRTRRDRRADGRGAAGGAAGRSCRRRWRTRGCRRRKRRKRRERTRRRRRRRRAVERRVERRGAAGAVV